METLLAAISGLGATAVFVLLIRNLIKCPALIAAAKFPAYVRMSYNMSFAVSLFCIVPWAAATFNASDFELWLCLMMSPIVFGLFMSFYSKRLMDRQSPEVKEYVQDLTRNSPLGRRMADRFDPDK